MRSTPFVLIVIPGRFRYPAIQWYPHDLSAGLSYRKLICTETRPAKLTQSLDWRNLLLSFAGTSSHFSLPASRPTPIYSGPPRASVSFYLARQKNPHLPHISAAELTWKPDMWYVDQLPTHPTLSATSPCGGSACGSSGSPVWPFYFKLFTPLAALSPGHPPEPTRSVTRHSSRLVQFPPVLRLELHILNPISILSSPQILNKNKHRCLSTPPPELNAPHVRTQRSIFQLSILPPAFSHPLGVTFVDHHHTTHLSTTLGLRLSATRGHTVA